MSSPNARTIERLRKEGWQAEPVEQTIRIPGGRTFKRDFLGCIDVIACNKLLGETLGVQATSDNGGNHAARRKKALAEPRLKLWLLCGNRFEIWSWKKIDNRWEPRREEIRLENTADLSVPARTRRKRTPKQPDLFAETGTG